MTHEELLELLANAGFDTGWVLAGETLTLWEHDADPPAPLLRPDAPVADEPVVEGEQP